MTNVLFQSHPDSQSRVVVQSNPRGEFVKNLRRFEADNNVPQKERIPEQRFSKDIGNEIDRRSQHRYCLLLFLLPLRSASWSANGWSISSWFVCLYSYTFVEQTSSTFLIWFEWTLTHVIYMPTYMLSLEGPYSHK